MAKSLSQDAQVAQLCRDYCKSIGVKASVKANTVHSLVNIVLLDVSPSTIELLKRKFNRYQWDDFSYEYKDDAQTMSGGIPHTQRIFIDNQFSDHLYSRIWSFLKGNKSLVTDIPSAPYAWEDAKLYKPLIWGFTAREVVYFIAKRAGFRYAKLSNAFWEE